MKYLLLILTLGVFFSCVKDTPVFPPVPEREPWEKFIGDYKVYDTTGVFLYDMSISHHYSGDNVFGNPVDSLYIENLSNLFEFELKTDPNLFDIRSDSALEDKYGYHWFFGSMWHDPVQNTNYYHNDTIILSYTLDNILHYINEGQPYYRCDCKEIAVKQ